MRPPSRIPLLLLLAALGAPRAARAAPTPWSIPEPSDLAANLVDQMSFDNLGRIEAASLGSAQLPSTPWSGSYWPLRLGGLAYRVLDPSFPKTAGWRAIERHLDATIGKVPTVALSPAEKYDVLLGDPNFTLTRRMMALASSQARGDEIEGWLGFCPGWANAAMMMPRPQHSVVVLAADGATRISFLPDDVKALGALLWNSGRFPFRVAGNACSQNPIEEDPTNGRATDPHCRDTNPATLHLAMVNQLGVSGRSLLIDSDPGEQVWNQPVSGYSTTYFHPKTGIEGSYAASRVRVTDYPDDPRAAFRAPGTQSIIGVRMALTFIYEKDPDGREVDTPETDAARTPVYEYELELDVFGRIVGGEWRSLHHPDLLWVAAKSAFPSTPGDRNLDRASASEWNLERALPADWKNAASESMKRGLPLGRIVSRLFDESRR